jgi:hypothetical protein
VFGFVRVDKYSLSTKVASDEYDFNDKTKWTTGRLLISLVAVFTSVSPYLADWNMTHIYNPAWPLHAKVHNAQTMVFGSLLGVLSMYCLWLRTGIPEKQKLNKATVLASLYWLAQLPATSFPGTALTDPRINSLKMPVILSVEFNQLTLGVTVIYPLIVLGYYLENRSLRRAKV